MFFSLRLADKEKSRRRTRALTFIRLWQVPKEANFKMTLLRRLTIFFAFSIVALSGEQVREPYQHRHEALQSMFVKYSILI